MISKLHSWKRFPIQQFIRASSSSNSSLDPPQIKSWKWLPPPKREEQTLEEEAKGQKNESLPKIPLGITKAVPVKKGVPLTKEEIHDLFVSNGAENVVFKPGGDLADAIVIATGRSNLHAKMLANLVVRATKERRLKLLNPKIPIEGEEEWFLVDTGDLMIHTFESEEKRYQVGLEKHIDTLEKKREILRKQVGEGNFDAYDLLAVDLREDDDEEEQQTESNVLELLAKAEVTNEKGIVIEDDDDDDEDEEIEEEDDDDNVETKTLKPV